MNVEEQLKQAQLELENLSTRIRQTDPNDEAALSTLVHQRDVLRGRIEALTSQAEQSKVDEYAAAARAKVDVLVRETRVKMNAESVALRTVLDTANQQVAPHLATVQRLVADAHKAWSVLPATAREEPPPFLFDGLAQVAARPGNGLDVLRAVLGVLDMEDRVAAQAKWEARQRVSEAEQEKNGAAHLEELKRTGALRIEAKTVTFRPHSRPYDGQ